MLSQLMVRARFFRSSCATFPMSEPQAGRKAAVPMSSTQRAIPTPAKEGKAR